LRTAWNWPSILSTARWKTSSTKPQPVQLLTC